MSTAARTYNQGHLARPQTAGRRRISIYWTWSYPWEAQRDPAAMENRFSTMTEVRNVLWPSYETPEYDAAHFLQGIAGTLELFHRSSLAFQRIAGEATGHPVAVFQRIDQAGYPQPIDERILDDTDTLMVFGLDHLLGEQEALPEEVEAIRAWLQRPGTCLLLTTSGSTGLPKIVPLPAAGVGRFVDWAAGQFGVTAGTRVLNYAPLNFDLCLLDVWATLCHGGEVVLVDPARAAQPRYLLELFAQAGPAVVQAVPMLFRLLTEAGDGSAFPEVRHVLLTGDHTPRRVRAALPAVFPRATFHNVYGCTETNDSFLHTFGPEQAATDDVLPLGRPIPGVEVALLDQGQVLTGPGTGELVVATPFQAAAYLGDEAPGDRFFRRVTDRGERTWYRTGDLVHRGADGRLTLAGRNDFQVKVRGVRVNLEEIERVIQTHDQVVEAVVVALPDPAAGTRLYAVVRTGGDGPSGLALRTYCAARLTRVAIPEIFRLVTEPLPVGPTGKVDRRRVCDHLMRELI